MSTTYPTDKAYPASYGSLLGPGPHPQQGIVTLPNIVGLRDHHHHHHHHGGDRDKNADLTTQQYFKHSSAPRVSTDTVIAASLKKQYPNLHLTTIAPYGVNLFAYAKSTGNASFTQISQDDNSKDLPSDLSWMFYVPPSRRIDGAKGGITKDLIFGKFLYKYKSAEFILYVADGRDGTSSYPTVKNYYLLSTDKETHLADQLVLEAGQWGNELHEEVWVWDGGNWAKSRDLFDSIRKASWDNVILDEEMKKMIIQDHLQFFEGRDQYQKLKVPWKRGVIYWGPPGNGKTISIKAMMHTLYDLKEPVPTLYVRSFFSWAGPEYAISQIFNKARQFAPCYLIFEDLDSLVTDQVRSYFLNEIDGLKSNDGIFIVGSTNHLDRLDPGISKRPSRFDRKYFFPDPDLDQRIAYCKFWQRKLHDNKDLEFPDKLCRAVADITDGFSFAYIQEAFVAALLIIARDSEAPKNKFEGPLRGDDDFENGWVEVDADDDDDDGDDIEHLPLWVELKKQIEILREGMEEKKKQAMVSRGKYPIL
ncbi:putative ATPase YjoB [Cladorrhinum sp. PSN259]|nr:putative ATPase YjoB [Cladorrhinum sp. PSN259]